MKIISINPDEWIIRPVRNTHNGDCYLFHKLSGILFYGYALDSYTYKDVEVVDEVSTFIFRLAGYYTNGFAIIKSDIYNLQFNAEPSPDNDFWQIIYSHHTIGPQEILYQNKVC